MFCSIHFHSAKLHWTDAHFSQAYVVGCDTLPETIQLHINVGGLPKQQDSVCGWSAQDLQVTSACGRSA